MKSNNAIYDSEDYTEQKPVSMTYDEYLSYKNSCEELITLAEQSARLAENPDFKSIIMDSYFTKEPVRLASLMSCGRLTDKQFEDCTKDLKAIGSIKSFLQDFIEKGNIARDELKHLEIAWNESIETDNTDEDS
jgi:hypothetical protein